MTWAERPTSWGAPGHVKRGSEDEAVLDQISSLTSPGFTSYTPSWTSTGSAPSIGNGSITGRYRRQNGSDMVYVEFRLVFGSTTTAGTGTYFFSLPVTVSASSAVMACGSAFYLDTAVQDYPGTVKVESTTTFRLMFAHATAVGSVTNTAPFTWGNGDEMRASLWYEAA